MSRLYWKQSVYLGIEFKQCVGVKHGDWNTNKDGLFQYKEGFSHLLSKDYELEFEQSSCAT